MNWTQGPPIFTSLVKIIKNVSQGVLYIFLLRCELGIQEDDWEAKYPGSQDGVVELECQGEYQVGYKFEAGHLSFQLRKKTFLNQGTIVGWCGTCLLSKGPGEPG